MKTSKLIFTTHVMLSAFLFLVIGWLIYPWLLDAVMAGSGVPLLFTSIDVLMTNRLWAALSFALLGAVTIGSFSFFKDKITAYAVICVMIVLILVALSALAGWLFYMQRMMVGNFVGMESIPISLSVEHVPVYEAGIFASVAVFLSALLLKVWIHRNKRNF